MPMPGVFSSGTSHEAGYVDADVREEARQLLVSWLRLEEEAAGIERKVVGRSHWPEGAAPRALMSERPPPPTRPQPSRERISSSSPRPILRASSGSLPVRRSGDLFQVVEQKLLELHSSANEEGPTGPGLREDVEVALNLLAERRRAAALQTAASRSASIWPSAGPMDPGRDPLLRMEARQQAISEKREAKRRAQSEEHLLPAPSPMDALRSSVAHPSSSSSLSQPRSSSARRPRPEAPRVSSPNSARARQGPDVDARAEEKRKAAEELRQRQEQKRKAEEAQRAAKAEEQRRLADERREKERAAALLQAQKEAALAQRREQEMKARARWLRKLLLAGFRAFRLAVVEGKVLAKQREKEHRARLLWSRHRQQAGLKAFRRAVADGRALAKLRRKEQEADELYVLHRLVEGLCAFKSSVIQAEEGRLRAWRHRRRVLLQTSLSSWHQWPLTQVLRARAAFAKVARQQAVGWWRRVAGAAVSQRRVRADQHRSCALLRKALRAWTSVKQKMQEAKKEAAAAAAKQRARRPASADPSRGTRASSSEVAQRPAEGTAEAGQEAPEQRPEEGPTSARAPSDKRPRSVVEMERRAEERKRVWEERREQQRLREEKRLEEQRETEEAQRAAEEAEKRRIAVERQERERAAQLLRTQRLVALAQHRQREQQARDLWCLHRLIAGLCAFRQVLIDAEEDRILAWRYRRRVLLISCLGAWWRFRLRARTGSEAARLSRYRLLVTIGNRLTFRFLFDLLQRMLDLRQLQVLNGRVALSRLRRRHLVSWWRRGAAHRATERRQKADQHYAHLLGRRAIRWWVTGKEQVRLEDEMERHKMMLRERVHGWLKELDAASGLRPLEPAAAGAMPPG